MTEGIALSYTVALLGFSDFEHGAMSSFFRLTEARTPGYVEATVADDADFLVVNADHPPAVALVQETARLPETVFVGGVAPAGAITCLHRPIAPTHIVRELDLLLEQRLARLDGPTIPDWMGSAPGLLDTEDGRTPTKDVLVVDDSRVALRFLQVRLQRRGYRVHTASTPEDALDRLAAQPFSMVFLDVALGADASMDGLALCQRIKQGKGLATATAPQVVLVTGLCTSSDRVRGELAGCDAYLTKPLMDNDFTEALRLLDPPLTA